MVAEGHITLCLGQCGLGVGNLVALQVKVEVAALLVEVLDWTWLV